MIVDGHAHLVPPSLLESLRARAADFPSVRLIEEGASLAFSFAGAKPTRPVSAGLTDVGRRLAWMDENGIDRQVVGGWLDMFGYELPADEGAAWAREINAQLAEAGRDSGNRFVPLATVPLQDGGQAAEVLREAHGAGFRGAMIGTQPKGRGGVLDDDDLTPFWQAADELRSAVFIHPVFDAGDTRVNDYGMANAIGRITDTLIAVSRIIYSGHVERYANARIVVGIGGAALPYVLGRLRRNHALHPEDMADPDKALSLLHYDTLVHDAAALRLLLDTVGHERVMLGSDMPFPIGDPAPRDILGAAGLSGAAREAVEGGVAARLLGLEEVSGA